MARLDIEIGAINAELRKVVADSEKILAGFKSRVEKNSFNLNSKEAESESRKLTLSLKEQRIATEEARTAAARAIASSREYALSQRKAKTSTDATIGSYKEAQQRLTALGQTIRNTAGGFTNSGGAIRGQVAEYNRLNTALKQFDYQMGNSQRNVGNYGSVLGGLGSQLSGVAASYLSLYTIIGAGGKIISKNAEISDSIADIQRTATISQEAARGLVTELGKLDTRTGLADLADIAIIGGQLGIAKEELGGFTEALDFLSVALAKEIPGGAEQVAKALGKINGVFRVAETDGLTAGQAMQKTGSAILALGQAGLATGEFLVDFTQRVAGVARVTGIALPTMLAYGAVLEEAGVSAEVAGTAIAKLIGNLAGKRDEFFAIAKLADANLTIGEFTNLINTDADAALRKFFSGLQAGGKTTTQFYDILKSAQINTERYRNAVLLLATDQGKLAGKVELSTTEFEKGTKAAQQAELRNNTLGASIDKLSKSVELLTTSGNVSDFFKAIVDGSTASLNAVNKLTNSQGFKDFLNLASGRIKDVVSAGLQLGGNLAQRYRNQYGEASLSDRTPNVSPLASQAFPDRKVGQLFKSAKQESEATTQAVQETEKALKARLSAEKKAAAESEKIRKQAIEDQARYVADLSKLRQQIELDTLSGYQRELQASKNKWDEELKNTKHSLSTQLELRKSALAETIRILSNAGLDSFTTPFNQSATGQSVRQSNTARTSSLGSGKVVDVQLPAITKYISDTGDEFGKEMTRAVRRFSADFYKSMLNIGSLSTRTFQGVFSDITTGFTASMDDLFLNFFQKKLEETFKKSAKSLEEWQKTAVAAAGLAGTAISSLTNKTSTAGQGIGGALSGAAAGTAIAPGIGTAIGAVIGGLAGIFGANSAKKQAKLQEEQLRESEKQTKIMERTSALTYLSNIIGRATAQGIVTSADVNEFGVITARLSGQEFEFGIQRGRNSKGRGI